MGSLGIFTPGVGAGLVGWEAWWCAEDEGDVFAAQDLAWHVGPPWEEDPAAVEVAAAACELRLSAVDADGTKGIGAGAVGWDAAGEPGGGSRLSENH